MVYVTDRNGHPLMPTERYGKVRRMLKENKAIVIKRCPFTIRLLYDTGNVTQNITLGVDAGSKHIGLSATTENKELYAAEVELRNDITRLLSQRREQRSSRRSRKTRYRKARFDNRRRPEGWLAPSVQNKADTHLKVIEDVHKILPVTEIVIECADFDLQKLKADMECLKRPEGKEYQEGKQLGFFNAREYVLFRDGHTCQCCMGRSKDGVLEIHHIESRLTGGDAPDNLITLCSTCHNAYHKGEISLPESISRKASFRDAAFMGIIRWHVYGRLKETYPNVRMTYGYVTKNTRIRNGLEKSHIVDARCISGHPLAEPAKECFYQKKMRCHNRQLHKLTIAKGGYRKNNQAPKYVFGYRLFDRVKLNEKECFIFGRRTSGSFDVRTLDGTKLSAGISYKKLSLIERQKSILTERRAVLFPMAEARGIRTEMI